MPLYETLKYVKVNREAKHDFWRELYRAQGPKRFAFSVLFIFLGLIATIGVILIVCGVTF